MLLSAYACRPGAGSEPGTGWHCAASIGQTNVVCVLTQGVYAEDIREELARAPIPNLRVVYVDLPKAVLSLRAIFELLGVWRELRYYCWQIAAYRCARRLCRVEDFDVVHHITFAKYWAPSLVSFLDRPFVWGPVGGGEIAPFSFWGRHHLSGKIYELKRFIARAVGEFDPFVRGTARHSAVALATTDESAKRMRKIGARNVTTYPAIGISEDDLAVLDANLSHDRTKINFISIGRLLHWKGFDLGIEAFARAALPSAEYWIVGDGPDQKHLERLARSLGVADRVRFLGRLTRNETLKKLGQCDVLVHPSLHESGGLVCLEAMAARRPVICLNIGGPATLVVENAGYRIEPASPGAACDGISDAMKRLAADGELRVRMGEAGRRHVESKYLWVEKSKYFSQIYTEAISLHQVANGAGAGFRGLSSD